MCSKGGTQEEEEGVSAVLVVRADLPSCSLFSFRYFLSVGSSSLVI